MKGQNRKIAFDEEIANQIIEELRADGYEPGPDRLEGRIANRPDRQIPREEFEAEQCRTLRTSPLNRLRTIHRAR